MRSVERIVDLALKAGVDAKSHVLASEVAALREDKIGHVVGEFDLLTGVILRGRRRRIVGIVDSLRGRRADGLCGRRGHGGVAGLLAAAERAERESDEQRAEYKRTSAEAASTGLIHW